MGLADIACCLIGNFTALLLVSVATLLGIWLFRRRFIEHQFFKKHGIDGPKPDLLFGKFNTDNDSIIDRITDIP